MHLIWYAIPRYTSAPFHERLVRANTPSANATRDAIASLVVFDAGSRSADALAHGLVALDVDYIRTVDDAVDDGIGDGALAELRVPASRRELRADDERSSPQTPLDDLEQLAGALPVDALEEPVVEYEQVAFQVAPLGLQPFLVLDDGQLVEHLGQPHVADAEERVARGHAERARDPRLARARRAGDQHVPVVLNPLAVRQLDDLGPVELAVGVVADVGDVRLRLRERSLAQELGPLVGPPRVLLGVDHHGEPLVEGHVGGSRRFLLVAVGLRHHRQAHPV